MIVRFGRIGTNGQTQTKELGSETAAAFHVAKLIKEKLAKGYVAVAGKGPGTAKTPSGADDFQTGITRPPTSPPYEVPTLPRDGPFDIEGIRLPTGRRLDGNPSMAPPGIEMITAPVVWVTDASVAECGHLLYRLREPLAKTGLTPVLLASMEADDTRPWDSRELSPTDPRRVDYFDVDQVLGHVEGVSQRGRRGITGADRTVWTRLSWAGGRTSHQSAIGVWATVLAGQRPK